MKTIPAVVAAMFACLTFHGHASDAITGKYLSFEKCLELVEASHAAIWSFDVVISTTTTFPLKTEEVETRTGVTYRWVEWGLSETPLILNERTRQVFVLDGRYRVEYLPIVGEKSENGTIAVFDGEVTKTLISKSNHGYVGKRDAHMVGDNRDYCLLTHCLYAQTKIATLMRERQEVVTGRLKSNGDTHDLVIDVPANLDGSLSQYSFKAVFSGMKGYALSEIEMRDSSKVHTLLNRMTVTDWKQLDNHVWVPIAATLTSYDTNLGKDESFWNAVNVVTMEVDLTQSKWNIEIDDDLFQVDFPPGIAVVK